MTAPAQSPTTPHSPGQPAHWMPVRPRLVAASAFMLFLELALIRWTGSNIVHLSYFTNFVLLGSFLGIGLGFLRVGRTRRQPYYSAITLAALVLIILRFPVTVDRETEGVLYWTSLATTGPPAWLILPIIFCAAAVVLMGPAELVGRCFPELPRLDAYRYDLIGSLTGIALFTALSFLSAPPVVWGVVAAVAYVALLWPRGLPGRLLVLVPSLVVVTALAVETVAAGALWSPYYKVTTERLDDYGVPVLDIKVNGIPHQRAVPAERRLELERQYALPYERAAASGRLGDVLIVGAGSGTDVAIALREGARRVDAVEIDPQLLRIGRESHPDRPYDDPRVTTHVADGRAFLERTGKKYDLILFALPDSLTLVSGASSLRLESYLFTREAMEAARAHLKPGGAFSMYNYYRERWLVDRLAATMRDAFGHAPCVDVVTEAGQQAVITAGLTARDQRCGAAWTGPAAGTPPPTGDDRPFLYLKDRTIPELYVITLVLILIVSLLAVRVVAGPYSRMRPYGDLFLLGVGFLLLETKSVTGFALLFGTTWVVNAIVFAGVLVAVLAAVEVTRRFRTPPVPVMYGVLAAGLLLAWLVPNAWLLSLPLPLRAVAAVAVAFLPIFAANVVFAKRFAESSDGTLAFGANLLGAMVGGCLEYLALLVGYQGLLIVAAVLYLGAFVLLPRRGTVAA
ncbi:hypothetical protein Misp01_17370 [Microtetraspora sp. NBRC 13810]|uniref:spermine/spermidine synthase domain-containing protein n=1 Tax=Microtetraspora sp. NBRC 13810 TaxID=3030990 RepID=UPI0024A01F23|nr:spermidine synthase [Microtetraspora sp. NBRC 13810]GLW06607.1 hypothetical protein Misp01_17370 [Microtetraspora sp. NBRC 13810]